MTAGATPQPDAMGDSRVIVVANRAPFTYERQPDGTIRVRRSSGGLVTALEPLIRSVRGTWVGQAATTVEMDIARRANDGASPAMSNHHVEYQLRYVSLREEERCGYYYGFANEGLWPLCHSAGVEPTFRADDFHMYQRANARFAAAVVEESAGTRPVVLVQDYHLALAPRLIRQRLQHAVVVAFWHIPWPRPTVFGRCPWARELLDGLLASDIVGFQTDEDCLNFLGSVEALGNARVDAAAARITHAGRSVRVRSYPVSIDWTTAVPAGTPDASESRRHICELLGLPPDVKLAVGVDRLDYTKGIPEKLLAVETLLEDHPEWRGRFVLVQIAAPSRDCLAAYQRVRQRVVDIAARVNARFGTDAYRPVHLLESHHDSEDVCRLYRASDVCIVASLHDGMNLVAKEFVRARDDEQGVLMLSRHAGASQQLRGAQIIAPRDIDGTAAVLADSLDMPAVEQQRRMRVMRAEVASHDARWWTRRLMNDAAREAARLVPGASVAGWPSLRTVARAAIGG